MTLAAIDWAKLFELVWAAALAGFMVAVVFSTLIVGIIKASDCRREGRDVAATAYVALAVVAMLGFAGVVIFGVSIIVSK